MRTFGISALLLGVITASNRQEVHMQMIPVSVDEAGLEDKYSETIVSHEFVRS